MTDAEREALQDNLSAAPPAAHHRLNWPDGCSAPLSTLRLQVLLDLIHYRAWVVTAVLREQQQVGHEVDDVARWSRVSPSAGCSFSVEVCVEGDLSEFGSSIKLGHGRSPRPPGHDYSSQFGHIPVINPPGVTLLPTAVHSGGRSYD
jgi:hypothetical protein